MICDIIKSRNIGKIHSQNNVVGSNIKVPSFYHVSFVRAKFDMQEIIFKYI